MMEYRGQRVELDECAYGWGFEWSGPHGCVLVQGMPDKADTEAFFKRAVDTFFQEPGREEFIRSKSRASYEAQQAWLSSNTLHDTGGS